MRHRNVLWWCAFLLLPMLACGDDDSASDDTSAPDGGSSDGGSSDGGATDGGTTGDPCDPRDPSTTVIGETQRTGTYPTPSGGSLADGVYELTGFEVYSPASADTHTRARRVYVSGALVTVVQVDDGGPVEIIGGAFTTAGSDLEVALECPDVAEVTVPYTATGAELWLFDPSEPNVQIYERL